MPTPRLTATGIADRDAAGSDPGVPDAGVPATSGPDAGAPASAAPDTKHGGPETTPAAAATSQAASRTTSQAAAPEILRGRIRCGGCGLATGGLSRDPGHVDWLVQNEPQWLCPSCARTARHVTGREILAALIFVAVTWYSLADIARWGWLMVSAAP